MDKLKKLMDKKKGEGQISDVEKNAKMSVLHDLKNQASEAMAGGLHNLKKVSVASDSEEGLKKGLDKAKEILGAGRDGYAENMEKHNSGKLFGEGTPEHEAEEPQSEREEEEAEGDTSEMDAHERSDEADGLEGHGPEVMHPEFAHMSEDEINDHLSKLMAHKKAMAKQPKG